MKSRSHAVVLFTVLAALMACQSAQPPADPVLEPEPAAELNQRKFVTVDASALNMRDEPTMEGEILTQIERGERLELLEEGASWTKVLLPDGRTAWAASRFLLKEGERSRPRNQRSGCPPDSDFAILDAPTLSFSDASPGGTVVIEVHVSANGRVKSTKVISNSTGDEVLAARAEQEIASAEFIAPVRNCKARDFIYTYRRDF